MVDLSTSPIALLSFTLCGERDAALLQGALGSVVGLADWRLVVWTDAVDWRPGDPRLAPTACSEVRSWRWSGRFDEARNAGLDLAAETGCEWGAMLDSDEAVLCPDPAALRAFLAALPARVQVAAAMAEGGHYARERFFRLPQPYRFSGRTHEAFSVTSADEQAMVPPELVQWRELPKTAEQLAAKFERDILLLREEIVEDPQDQRWHYYLGTSLQALGRHEEALDAFRSCAALGGGEGIAFACARAAQSLVALGERARDAGDMNEARERWNRAVDACASGSARYPGIGELYGFAAVAHMRCGRVYEAEDAATIAKALGMGTASERRRMGFRLPEMLGPVPDQVLAWVASAREATT